MSFGSIVRDIRSLKIQGANAIALKALEALDIIVHSSKDKTELDKVLSSSVPLLVRSRPTEPCMRNAINYVMSKSSGRNYWEYKESLHKHITEAAKVIRDANSSIAEIGANKISSGMTIFTHCHSSTVIAILLEAKRRGKKFTVHNTETRPRFQGRKTAEELAKAKIPVVHYVDAAARYALKNCDMMLIGCDAITSEGKVVNKIGSELFSEVAHRYDIPVYSCTNSWKFDPKTVFGFEEEIEMRSSEEIWPKAPKGIRIDNFAFEMVRPELVAGVISEIGIYPPRIFVEEMKTKNPWMFKGIY